MGLKALTTLFAPAERAAREKLSDQMKFFLSDQLLVESLNAIPEIVVALNQQRQIVFANRRSQDAVVSGGIKSAIGLRPGEALGCVHSDETEGGCGTTEFCRHCGAVKSILAGLNGKVDTQECRIMRRTDLEPLDLRVTATPFELNHELFTVVVINDISHEKRRRSLEHIFFHDVLNTALGINGLSEILKQANPNDIQSLTDALRELARRLADEITEQRDLVQAEDNELTVHPSSIDALSVLKSIVSVYQHQKIAKSRSIVIAQNSLPGNVVTDETMLRRIIGNLVKNALEASHENAAVTLGTTTDGKGTEFWVHNDGAMPREVQLQLFQRSFSTKGKGRGLGTYSIKLLTERYLNGKVSFTSSLDDGTTFRVTLPNLKAD